MAGCVYGDSKVAREGRARAGGGGGFMFQSRKCHGWKCGWEYGETMSKVITYTNGAFFSVLSVEYMCRYFQHAHFIRIVGVGKRGAH